MMNYKKRQHERLYNDPVNNFSKILDAYIYFKNIDDVESFEVVYILFNMDSKIILKLLTEDLLTRNKEDYNSLGYKHLWWLLSNDAEYISLIKANPIPEELKNLFNYWIDHAINKNDSFCVKISKILKK